MANSRQKGKRGELEVAGILRGYGYSECRRGQQYCGSNGDADVVGLPGVHIEVKRRERLDLYDAVDQAKRDSRGNELPSVFHRKNNCEWLGYFHYTRKQWFFPAKQRIYQDLKVPKIQQKTRVLCASFLRCLDRFWLLNINARHQPVELPPCKIPDLRFIPGPPVRSLGGQSFVDHNDPVRFF